MIIRVKRRLKRAFGAPERPVPPPKISSYPEVELVSWAPKNGTRNFGDHLSRIVVSAMLARRGLTLDDQVNRSARMLAIGSILHFSQDGDTVWGSGINGKVNPEQFRSEKLDVRAVRGPLTAGFLRENGHDAPDIFGDPGLLVPTLFPGRFVPDPTHDYLIVPNLHDLEQFADDDRLISPLWGWNKCIHAICSARFIIASSLHGIILAEALGIPARYLRVSETESRFKYDDYAQGTGRESLDSAASVEEALDLGPHAPIQFNPQSLMDAFPFDLWDGASAR